MVNDETAARGPETKPFPRVFWVANGIEVLERAAFYGVYVNLQVYLLDFVHMSEVEVGSLLGLFALARAVFPLLIGGVADVLGFRTSLICAFALYVGGYSALYAAPTRLLAYGALFGMAIAGAFMKPVVSGSVQRYSPSGRQTEGFAIFYAAVNGGSAVGKVLTWIVRTFLSLRASLVNAIVACSLALLTAIVAYREPARDDADAKARALSAEIMTTLRAYGKALSDLRLGVFLIIVAGYYLLIEQFYQTFPVYMARAIADKAPRELFTLINPISIAIFQVLVARVTRRLDPLLAMSVGIALGAVSMLAMSVPMLITAGGSFFVFALAEMTFSPRYYSFVGSFAPKGKEGLFMGLALAPAGLGGLIGGVLSGRLIARFLPKDGPRSPLAVWGTYAALGLLCALMMLAYRAIFRAKIPVQAA